MGATDLARKRYHEGALGGEQEELGFNGLGGLGGQDFGRSNRIWVT
jgi:hypothetical protein